MVTVLAMAAEAAPSAGRSSARVGARPNAIKPNAATAARTNEGTGGGEEHTRFTAAFLCWGSRRSPGTDRLPIDCTISSEMGSSPPASRRPGEIQCVGLEGNERTTSWQACMTLPEVMGLGLEPVL